MKKINQKLRLQHLRLLGCATVLLISGMTNSLEAHAQKSLLDSTSININGAEWTFRTPPPPESQRQIITSHPRLFITQANLAQLREKLSDSLYASDLNKLGSLAHGGNALANAFLYLLEDDTGKGIVAKNWLLTGSFGDVVGLDRAGDWVEPILIFDWVMPLLSSSERKSVFEKLKANFKYDHRTASDRGVSRYWNDEWARHQELHYPILALAIAGDGIDDAWANEVLDLVYNESPLVMGPYGATKGAGFLDMLASVSLDDGGGTQTGAWGSLGTYYYTMYLHSFMPMGAWETATGEAMWARSPFFQKLPFYWAYEKNKRPSGLGSSMPEIITGIYRNIDPDAAALARWQVDKWGRSNYLLVYRLLLGDLRVTAKSPQDLGLPTAKYIRGADMFVSSRNWDENAVTLTAFSRYLDTNRFEPASGTFAIYRGKEPLAVPAEPHKLRASAGSYSGMWFYDPTDNLNVNSQGLKLQASTYWGLGPSRADSAYEAVSQSGYFPGGPDNMVITNTYRGMSTEYSNLLEAPGVRTARQTIVHIIDTNRDFIVVYNYTDVPLNIKRAWSMRLAVPPNLQENGYLIPGMNTTVVAPSNNTISWVGGIGDELKSPPSGKIWYGNNRNKETPGYSSDLDKAKKLGIGNLFVQPQNPTEQVEFLVVMDISDQPPVAVSRTSDREVRFGDWQVSFNPNGDFNVVNSGPLPPDLSPPSSPTDLVLQ